MDVDTKHWRPPEAALPLPRWTRRADVRGSLPYFVAMAAVGLWWLFAPSGALPQQPPDLSRLPRVDGTLTVVEPSHLELRPFRSARGQRPLSFVIRSRDSRNFDLAHMRSHSALGVPTRIYFERQRGRLVALYKQDAPANGSRAS